MKGKKPTPAVHTETIKTETSSNSEDNKVAGIMVNLIKQQRSLYSKSIADWLAAKQTARNPIFPQRVRLYDIYDDMMDDDFVYGLLYNQRIMPIINRANKIVAKDGKKDDKVSLLFQERWFDNVVQYILESKFFGHSLIYMKSLVPGEPLTNEVELHPRRHVYQEFGLLKVWESDFEGISYEADPVNKYVLSVGEKYDLGLLNKAVPLWIIKKHGWQNWDEFAERFGIPIIAIKTASQDKRVIAEIEEWARELSTGAYGVFPDDTNIEIKENSKTDAFKVFAEMIRMAQEGLAILFVGQTMTSMNGSSKSQAEVHADVATEIRRGDEKFIKYELAILINKLRQYHGWPIPEDYRFEWDVPEDVEALLNVFKVVNEMGFQLNSEEVSTRLGIKIDGVKAPIVLPSPNADPSKETDPDKAKELEKALEEKAKKDKTELAIGKILKMHAKIAELHHV